MKKIIWPALDSLGRSLSQWQHYWIPAVFILLFTLIFFKEAVFQGKILSPIDAACPIDPVWNEVCGQVEVAKNGLIGSDQAAQFYPWRSVVRRLLQAGQLPLWNPYNSSGYPLLANTQSSVFYPVNLLADLFPIEYAFTVSAVLRIFITGLGVFLLGRELKLSVSGALFAAIAFAFSTPVMVWLGYAIIEVMAFFPLLLYFTEKIFRDRHLGFTLAAGMVFGLMGLAGHPQTLLMGVLTWTVYVAGRLLILKIDHYSWLNLGQIVLKLGVAGLLGVGVGAVQLLPTWQMAQNSIGYLERGRSINPGLFESGAKPGYLLSLILFVWPHFFGNPAWPEVATGAWFRFANYNTVAVYLGFLPLVLLPFAFLKGSRRIAWIYMAMALISVGLFLQLPLFYALTELGWMEKALPERFRLFTTFALAMLGGYGLDGFVAFRRKRLYAAIIVVITLALSLTLGLAAFKLVNQPYKVMLSPESFSISRMMQSAAELPWPSLDALAHNSTLVFGLPLALTLALLLLAFVTKNKPTYLGPALVALIAIDLYAVNAGFNVTNDVSLIPERLAQQSSVITYLRQTMQPSDRLVAFGPVFLPNSATLVGLADARGYDVMMPGRYYRLFASGPGYHQYGPGGFFLTQPSPVLRILSVNYVLTPVPLPGLEPVFISPSGLLVYRLPDALPRAFLVHDYRVLPTETVFQTVLKGDFDPATTVLIEEPPPVGWPSTNNTDDNTGLAQIIDYQPSRVTLTVDTRKPAILVLADGYDAGWNVYVNGVRQPVYRANYVVRAVFLDEGQHQVDFVYEPLTFKIGAALTIFSLLVIAVAGVMVWRYKHRQNRP